ncbi:hypothetical protein LOTGIDRAFT_230170 [Lottia gigantea]|uniref:Cadherin domain-containing protein n=1 Tax=Lottia gigantea TaxID=225164 RepID=V4AIA5_LOTGI|nr:hypothetical protein LOTGIDRAFT_230170 [Lottia gigantea]ESP03824.1 hypothetical protein LOTGIDRAFT_230170 [Lottia gigantea]
MHLITGILFCMFLQLVFTQKPCDPIDDGPYLGTQPTLDMSIYEASQSDLDRNPGGYQAELRIYGKTGETTADGIILEVQDDFPLTDPRTILEFTKDPATSKNIIKLIKPVDRDGPTDSTEDGIQLLPFTLKCSSSTDKTVVRYYDVRVFILDINDNYPQFTQSTYNITVNELTPVGSEILRISATDKDENILNNMTYSIISLPGSVMDASMYFDIEEYTGTITVSRTLDYESLGTDRKYFTLTVEVQDGAGKSNQTYVTINILDGDDQGVAFVYPGCLSHRGVCAWPKYSSLVSQLKMNKQLMVYPVPNKISNYTLIQARDLDLSLKSRIQLSIASTIPPGSEQKFRVETVPNPVTGLYTAYITPIQPLPTLLDGFEIFLKAEEQTDLKRFEMAMIYFIDDTIKKPEETTESSQVNPEVKPTDEETSGYSHEVTALIVAVTVVAVVLLCTIIGLCYFVKYSTMSTSKYNYNMQTVEIALNKDTNLWYISHEFYCTIECLHIFRQQ